MKTIHVTLPGGAQLQGVLREPTPEMPAYQTRPAVLVVPGGGYSIVCSREAEPVAAPFLAAGYHVFTLTYTVAPDGVGAPLRYKPLADAARALLYLRRHAAELWLDPARVAICGFSAGGHLAASTALIAADVKDELGLQGAERVDAARPNAVILCYPVITGGPFAHAWSIDTLAGDDAALHDRFSLENQVTDGPGTPPFFVWHTVDDELVPVENSLLLAGALRRAGVPFEMHLFTHGAHGGSTCTNEVGSPSARNRAWVPLAIDWLADVFDYHF